MHRHALENVHALSAVCTAAPRPCQVLSLFVAILLTSVGEGLPQEVVAMRRRLKRIAAFSNQARACVAM